MQRLDADGLVEFKNGATITVEHETDLRIGWPGTLETGYVNQWAHDQLARAYALAMEGAPPSEPPRPLPPRRQPTPRDYGPCPF